MHPLAHFRQFNSDDDGGGGGIFTCSPLLGGIRFTVGRVGRDYFAMYSSELSIATSFPSRRRPDHTGERRCSEIRRSNSGSDTKTRRKRMWKSGPGVRPAARVPLHAPSKRKETSKGRFITTKRCTVTEDDGRGAVAVAHKECKENTLPVSGVTACNDDVSSSDAASSSLRCPDYPGRRCRRWADK